jgi:CRISPR-associated protein Csx10
MLKLTFEITLRSDYHVGAGHGLGFNVDAALQRDADGVPVIRGSNVVGLLRGSLERLATLSPLKKYEKDKADLPDRLFGTAAEPKRWYFSSARPVGLEQPLYQGAWRPGRDGAQQVTRVRVNPRTRRAKPGQLFSKEVGDGRLKFRFQATCHATDDAALDEAALLVATARYVRQLGGSRRRGLGECVIHLTQVDGVLESFAATEAGLLQRFREAWLDGMPHLSENKAKPEYPATLSIPGYDGSDTRVRFVVRLNEPLVIAERAVAGNQFDTCPVIPGSVVRGALAGRAARLNDLSDPQTYAEFVALFLRGSITFPNLYLAYHYEDNLYPTVPAPLGLLTCEINSFSQKREGHGLWVVDSSQAQTCKCPECEGRPEPVSGFMILKQRGPYTVAPDEKVELHIRIDSESNRVSHGDLYGYTVLNPGQYFVGELICADENAWTHLQALTGLAGKTFFSLRLGKARRRGYGRVKVWVERCDDQPVTWLQVPLEERVPNLDEPVTLTLLTDMLIVDRWGRQAAEFDSGWMEQELGLGPVQVQNASSRAHDIDGFHGQTGLPRWRDQMLQAGSMAVAKFTSPPQDWQTRVRNLETKGIGLRRNEGFGRIAFNHPVYEKCQRVTGSNIGLPEGMQLDSTSSDEFIGRERRFVQWWEKKLRKDSGFQHCRDQRFTAVARMLHIHADKAPRDLKAQLASLGELPEKAIELVGGEGEYGKRHTLKPEADQLANHPGIKLVDQMLTELEKLEEYRRFWPLGVQMLAERIAAAVETEKEE